MSITEKLAAIQAELKAPKGQYNSFGKYKYRSCEDILEAVKPLAINQKAALTLTDDMVQVGDRIYIKATATLSDCEADGNVTVSAFAREEETKKGMDASQVTGAASSYARKYALNGLFCIDDTKDSNATNTGDSKPKPEAPKPEEKKYRCMRCDKDIMPTKDKDGILWPVEKIVNASLKKYGSPYCIDCMKKIAAEKKA